MGYDLFNVLIVDERVYLFNLLMTKSKKDLYKVILIDRQLKKKKKLFCILCRLRVP